MWARVVISGNAEQPEGIRSRPSVPKRGQRWPTGMMGGALEGRMRVGRRQLSRQLGLESARHSLSKAELEEPSDRGQVPC